MNGQLIGEIVHHEHSAWINTRLPVPAGVMKKGENLIRLRPSYWRMPSEDGGEDSRSIGFGIFQIGLRPI